MMEDYDLTAIIGKLELLKRNLQQQKIILLTNSTI